MHRESHEIELRPDSNPPILHRIRSLRLSRSRDLAGLHFIEGLRPVVQALEAAMTVETLVYSERLCWNPSVQNRVRRARKAGVPVARLTPEQFRQVSLTPRASGLGAILRQHWTPLGEVDPCRGLCWVAVGRVRSPGNLGTILRTAEAVGAGGAFFLGRGSDPFDPGVVRATMGGLFRLQLVRTGIEEFREWSRRRGCRVIGASPSPGATLYTEVPVEAPLVVFLGEERRGITPDEESVCTHAARIPILGSADSLNVGVAAGVMLYEVLRRATWLPLVRQSPGAPPASGRPRGLPTPAPPSPPERARRRERSRG